MLAKILSLMLLLLCINSCSLPFPHGMADKIAPRTLRSGVVLVAASPAVTTRMWWKRLHDPVLNHLMSQALADSNSLQNSRANVLQAQAQLQEARMAWLPTANATGTGFVGQGWDSVFQPQTPLLKRLADNRRGKIDFHAYFMGFMPSYSLNVLKNTYTNRVAAASLAMQQAMHRSVRLSVISQVSGAYFMLLGQRQQRSDQRQYLRDLNVARRLEWLRYQQGATDISAVTDLDQQIAVNETHVDRLNNSTAQLENTIQVLLNKNPAPLPRYGDMNHLRLHALLPRQVSSEVLRKRPDIMVSEENLRMASANIGVAYANFFPSISLTNPVGSSSLDLVHLLKLHTGLWVLQGAANLPLFNGVSYTQIKQAKAGYLASYFQYMQTLRAAFADVDNALTHQKQVNAIYQHQFVAWRCAQKNHALARTRYQAGARDYRDVVNAKLAVDSAKINLTLARMQQWDTVVEVYQALGL